MKRIKIFLLGLLLVLASTAKADEGMWLLPLLQKYNIGTMQSMGLELSADDIYSINNGSIKDAIVIFGGGCTGEIISDKGLLLTNHHCGYGAIQSHSSTEHDYLKDGFWAMNLDEELPTPGLSVTFLVSIEEVTKEVTKKVKSKMTEEERSETIQKAAKKIEEEAGEGNHYRASVRNFYGGNKYYLLVYEIFTDVRMVGAPPSSIGKFGADSDNWMWPRHTGDFAIFRVYADKDNKPADYSPDNQPYTPKHHLPISLKGIEKNDFAMIMGYPGGTTRYMTSWEVDETEKITNAQRSFIRGIRQEIILEDMLASDEIRIKYASKYSGSSNYWKFSIGQNQSLKRLKIKEGKQAEQEKFTKWVNQNRKRTKTYGEALNLIETAIEGRRDYMYANLYLSETMLRGTEIISFALRANGLAKVLEKGDAEEIEKQGEELKESARGFYKNYNAPTDRKVAKAMFKLYADKVKEEFHPSIFATVYDEFNGEFNEFIDNMFDNSMFVDSAKLWKFLDNPTAEEINNDPAFAASTSIINEYREIKGNLKEFNEKFSKGHRLYVAGIMEMNDGQPMYPDANFTMRLTYGKVLDYYPRDAVHYNYYTTLNGVMEKEDPDNWEFVVPEKLKELYHNKDYGQYATKDGDMPLNFISNNDITGGNSGSPVINGKGELIGTAFDGNWEAMSGDIVFENKLQRCINVDIRYTLFIIDKYAGAKHLIDEMTIVK
ncbi:MAG: S46 family peptidase [Bacteroidales bacterium]|nr:S46 family peptidase [Bacteroidales bacterium]MDD4671635.1 S46 family peptidase [Bacteroidales bacterium]